MGNPSTPQLMQSLAAYTPGPRLPTTHNGMLGWLASDTRHSATQGLPPPRADEPEPVRHVELQDPTLGRVRVRVELASHKHYRSTIWRWSAVWADVIEPPP